jgi:hypothetical protein
MDRLKEQLRKMETAKDEQTKMLNEANAKIEAIMIILLMSFR